MTDVFDKATGSPYALAPLSVAQAFVLGRTCGEHPDGDIGNCPYPVGTHEHAAWKRGFAIPAIVRAAASEATRDDDGARPDAPGRAALSPYR